MVSASDHLKLDQIISTGVSRKSEFYNPPRKGCLVSFFAYPNEPPAAAEEVEQLLPDASDEEWATLLKHTRHRSFVPGDAVVTAGALDRSLYLVIDGLLEVLVTHGRRGYRRVATIGAGSVIGELSFFDGGARSALVRAVTPAELAELSPAEFAAFAIASPALARELLFDLGRILAKRLRTVQAASTVGGY
jgi:CRP/FNR family cyclic AMP-dependent transcriptional regulator